MKIGGRDVGISATDALEIDARDQHLLGVDAESKAVDLPEASHEEARPDE